ncbi:hypothetical protein TNCV_97861 [Trichonephila clavipes]|nr:hypothetical protein TNCV_97861 [Trichonephila clavipes]
MEFGLKRGGPCADALHLPIRDDLERERGPTRVGSRVDKNSSRSPSIFCLSFRISFFSSSKTLDRGCGGAVPQGPIERQCEDL